MNERKEGLVAVERRLKRRLGRHNLDLLKPQRLTPQIRAHGGYKLRDAATGKVVFGEAGYEFSASIEDIEAWLDAEDNGENG